MKYERVLITGCGRSGTGYTAKLLSSLGVATAHEGIFGLTQVMSGEVVWPDSTVCESSWLAAPFLGKLPGDVAVLHQVRDPLAVVRSFTRLRFFEERGAYWDFLARHMEGLADLSDLEAALRYWDEWNATVERGVAEAGQACLRICLEDFAQARVEQLLDFIGFEPEPGQLQSVMATRQTDYNTRGDKSRDGQITWESLPQGAALEAVCLRARSYGYEVPDWSSRD